MLHVTSVDPVSGEELASGELVTLGARGALPFRSPRGESLTTRSPDLAARIQARLRALEAEHGHPVRARFDIENDTETLASVEPAPLSPSALARVLVERVADGRLTRAQALTRITPAELEATGTFVLAGEAPPALLRGLAASAGTASGRLATPEDFEQPQTEPRILVIDDASPEDAGAIRASAAILATSGGLTSDAAIAARALRKPCIVSTPLRLGDRPTTAQGAWVTVDGTRGEIYEGALATRWSASSEYAAAVLAWLAPAEGERPGSALLRAQKPSAQG